MIRCPNCNASLKVPEASPGKNIRCGKCRRVFTIPDPGKEPIPDSPKDIVLLPASPPADRLILTAKRSKVPVRLIVGIGALLLIGGAVVAYFVLTSNSLPSLFRELPPGDVAAYYTRELWEIDVQGATPEVEFPPGWEVLATAARKAGREFLTVTVFKGKFNVGEVEERYLKRGFTKRTLEGYELWVKEGSEEGALSVGATRIVQGDPKFVVEALQVRDGRTKSFTDSVGALPMSLVKKVPRGDYFWVELEANDPLPGATLFWSGAAISAKKTGPKEVALTMAFTCPNDRDEAVAVTEMKKRKGFTILFSSRSERILTVRAKIDYSGPADPLWGL